MHRPTPPSYPGCAGTYRPFFSGLVDPTGEMAGAGHDLRATAGPARWARSPQRQRGLTRPSLHRFDLLKRSQPHSSLFPRPFPSPHTRTHGRQSPGQSGAPRDAVTWEPEGPGARRLSDYQLPTFHVWTGLLVEPQGSGSGRALWIAVFPLEDGDSGT